MSKVQDIDKGYAAIMRSLLKLNGCKIKTGVQGEDVAVRRGKKGKISRTDTPLAVIAAIHEYGLGGMPQRSFLRSTYDENKEKIVGRASFIIRSVMDNQNISQATLEKLGNYVQGLVQKKIRNGSFTPNAPSTIKRKGSSKPLIDTGHLRQSIRYVIIKGGDYGA